MRNLHFQNSFNEWTIQGMYQKICQNSFDNYWTFEADLVLHRTYRGMYIEWYLHNIGYWLTLPFIKNPKVKRLNERFKHLDLEEHIKK